MRKTLSILALLVLASAADAQVLAYNQAVNITTQGGSVPARKETVTGWLLYDQTLGDMLRVNVSAVRKRYHLYRPGTWQIAIIERPASVLTVVTFGMDGFGTASVRGLAVPTNVSGTPTPWLLTIPRTLTGSGNELNTVNQVDFLTDYTGSLIYNAVRTKSFNTSAPLSVDAAASILVAPLIALGYQAE